MNESLLFGVRVWRVFIVLRGMNCRYDHEKQPGTVQQNDLQQRKDHQSDKNCSNHSVPPKNGQKKTTVRVHRGSVDVMNYGVQQ